MANLKKTNIENKPKKDDQLAQSIKTNRGLSNNEERRHSEHGEKTNHNGIFKQKYNQAKIANLIAAVAVCVSIVLAVFTYSLFKQASNQTVVANKSAAAAVTADSIANNSYHLSDSIYKESENANKITFAETKRYNDGFLRAQQNIFDENKKDAISREQREKTTFEETKKDFEIENRPFLQTINLKIDSNTESASK
ncbi:hypothetical protein [Mucilaginibacter sp.]|uniref:hypothetical protein n=1 Tax=Mucilaginibacter sp. TaxID=1882438 RepID=UPI00283F798D|nr:hypothetical protein [Mucilaginibacter sp.]MDR3694803.1 hypothetical protein [Mucilaginibacter sp.]